MSYVFDDIFEIKEINPGGKKYFDRVTRVTGVCQSSKTDIMLDINTDLYPVALGDEFSFALTKKIALDEPTTAVPVPSYRKARTIADAYEYVMYGKVYEMDMATAKDGTPEAIVFVSFGGLLLKMKGEVDKLSGINKDDALYLLMRKTTA